MSQSPPVPPSDDLQFSTVEPAAGSGPASAPACAACRQPINDVYYAVGDKLICPACRERYAAAQQGGSRIGRLLKATVFGVGAGIVGALVWWGVRRLTGSDFGIIAVAVGFIVGGAVRAGSGARGGFGYQMIALALTYLSIALTFTPDVFTLLRQSFHDHHDVHATNAGGSAATSPATTSESDADSTRPARLTGGKLIIAVLLVIARVAAAILVAPVVIGLNQPIVLLIFGFALWEAWKINARARVPFAGPYSLAQGTGGGPGAGAMP